MKRIITSILLCLILVLGMIAVSCDNGDPPIFGPNDIEKQFIRDYGSLGGAGDFFDGTVEEKINQLSGP